MMPTKNADNPMKRAARPTKEVTMASALETGFRKATTAHAPTSMIVAKSQKR